MNSSPINIYEKDEHNINIKHMQLEEAKRIEQSLLEKIREKEEIF